MNSKRYIISILLQNEAGALTRVAGLFSNRGYNIESLNVAPTDDPTVSRITLVTAGTEDVVAQIVSQSLKLVDVVNVDDVTSDAHVERELLLLKLRVESSRRAEVDALLAAANARTLASEVGSMIVEAVDSEARLNALVKSVSQHAEVLEVVRSGALAILLGNQTLAS